MMAEVDGLTRRFGPLIAQYYMVANILSKRDNANRPEAYNVDKFRSNKTAKICITKQPDTPILTQEFIASETASEKFQSSPEPQPLLVLTTCPLQVIMPPPNVQLVEHANRESEMRALQLPTTSMVNWICIDDVTRSTNAWIKNQSYLSLTWNHVHRFTEKYLSRIFKQTFPEEQFLLEPVATIQNITSTLSNLHLFDVVFIPGISGSVISWLSDSS